MPRRTVLTTATEAPEPLPVFTRGEQADGGEEGTYSQTDVETKPKKRKTEGNEGTKEGCKEESLRPERHHQRSRRDTSEKEHDV